MHHDKEQIQFVNNDLLEDKGNQDRERIRRAKGNWNHIVNKLNLLRARFRIMERLKDCTKSTDLTVNQIV